MPRLLAAGHVTWDRRAAGRVLGGSAAYAALSARRLGWQAAVATSAGGDFAAAAELPGVAAFVTPSPVTTRFSNVYDVDGTRSQTLEACAEAVDLALVPEEWRAPQALLLAPVAGELGPRSARAFEAEAVGAIAQGFVRGVDADGRVSPREWRDPAAALEGVHVLFCSQHDLADADRQVQRLLECVPVVVVTRGWRGAMLLTRDARHDVPALPREEVDPTGAGDVFAAAFLVRYHECGDLIEAAAFASCAASCAVEGVGAATLGDRAEIERRLALRERYVEDAEWDE